MRMIKFKMPGDDTPDIAINKGHIISVRVVGDGKTQIQLSTGLLYVVEESQDAVIDKINQP